MQTEILVVGAGIHALSVVLRYLDVHADLLDETERSQYYMRERETIKKYGRWNACRRRVERWTSSGYEDKIALQERKKRLMVVDPSGEWLHDWSLNFEAYEIPHLRSPMDIHPSPRDSRDLLAFALNERRGNEFTTMEHKHGKAPHGFTGPHQLPGTKLFNDFCRMLIRCFELEDQVHPGYVTNIHECSSTENAPRRYKVALKDGSVINADHVVMALGPAMNFDTCMLQMDSNYPTERLVCAKDLGNWLASHKQSKETDGDSVLIIGGGITSGHAAKVACSCGFKPTLVQRSSTKVQAFDVDLRWMGKFRGSLIEKFRHQDLEERVRTCLAHRISSYSPEVHHAVEKLHDDGLLNICENTSISSLYWEAAENHWVVRLDNGDIVRPNYIWLSVGCDVQLDQYPVLEELMKTHPIETFCGLPDVGKDLKWRRDTSIYLLGALAVSQLGPDGLNMAGARHGSVLVARALRELSDMKQ